MPFTLAHPAAVLPIRRLVPSASAAGLAIGSMTPDLAYFLPVGVSGAQSHSIVGLLWFCVPMGVGGWLALRFLLAPAFERFLPSSLAARLCHRRSELTWSRMGAVGAGALAGAATHLAWDSFTHSSGAAVRAFPYLRQTVPVAAGYSPAIYTVLQHVSTVLGLAVLLAWCVNWYRRAPVAGNRLVPVPGKAKAVAFGAVLLPTAFAAVVVLGPAILQGSFTFVSIQRAIGRAAFASGSVFLAALFLVAVIIRCLTNRGRGEGAA